MKCLKCGAKVDKGKFCTECGTRCVEETNYVVQDGENDINKNDIDNEKVDVLNVIEINNNNSDEGENLMFKEIPIFGKTIQISDERMIDIIVHREIKRIAKGAAENVRNIFAKHSNFDEFWKHKDAFYVLLALVYSECEMFLEEIGITEIEGSDIQKLHHKRKQNYLYDALEELEHKCKEIILDFNSNNDERKLRKLYNDSSMRRELESAAYMEVYDLIPLIQYLLQSRGIADEPITIEDEEKGVSLFKCLKENKLDSEQAYKIAYQLFSIDPTEPEYYEWCIAKFPEEIVNLVKLERLAGYEPTKENIEKGYTAIVDKMPHGTEEETILLKKKLEDISTEIGITESVTIQKVDKLLLQFDLEARTFQNIVFSTRELKNKAEQDYKIIDEACAKIAEASEDKCKEKKEWLAAQGFVEEIKQIFIDKLEKRIIEIWIQEDGEAFSDIFINTNVSNAKDIEQSISQIEEIGRTEDKKRYIEALKGMSESNFELVGNYKSWNNKKYFEKYGVATLLVVAGIVFWEFYGIIMLIIGTFIFIKRYLFACKLKEVWEMLTLNGELIHPFLLQISPKEKEKINKIRQESVKICPSCKKQIAISSSFCKYCGEKVTE